MPETSEKILAQLGDGKVTEKPEILFARLDVEEVMKKVEELHPQMTAEEKENQADGEEETVIDIDAKPEITFDDFGKMQFPVSYTHLLVRKKEPRKNQLSLQDLWKNGELREMPMWGNGTVR